MSGKRHHFVPRFLQSGFTSHVNGYEAYTWVYRKGQKAFNTNTKNVGVEGQFYSLDGDTQLDTDITMEEERYSSLVDELRAGNPDALSDSNLIAELISHLEIRTRHLRENFSTTAEAVIEALLKFVADEKAFGEYVKGKIRNDPSLLHGAIEQKLRTLGIPESLFQETSNNIGTLFEQILPSLLVEMSKQVSMFVATIPELVKSASKSGHIRALKETLAPPLKAETYSNLKFRLIHSDYAMPLGDSIVVFEVDGERAFKPFSEKGDVIRAIYLPISSNQVIIGSTNDELIEMSELSKIIAQCSFEYFISSNQGENSARLQSHIGELAYLVSKNQLYSIIEDVIKPEPWL
ncbi:MAG TPA: DUF4238 domain-containing protein [Rheinheimera sp.]|uniref:DUF4238 domain-containing protein n=1 Tax=Rheinheimera sp. TaxID=1869214 RepID=UPI002B4AAC97|nr:DUF4238 domain-containing protein [Rheinheimera sp.]HJS16054.1 DUF4238 domain-containing protein [Rheinheimera sp.]